jgi:positive regulator of sigma E activity
VRELAYVTLLGTVGVSAEQALAAALLSYLTTLLVSFVGGAVLASEILDTRTHSTTRASARPTALGP